MLGIKSKQAEDEGSETTSLLAKGKSLASPFASFSKHSSDKPISYGLDTTYDAESDLKHFGDGGHTDDKTSLFIAEVEQLKRAHAGRPPLAQAAWQGIKQNLIPGLVLQVIGTLVVVSYYTYPPAATYFNKIASLKEQSGYLFSFISTSIFGGIIPFLIMLLKDYVARRKQSKAKAAPSKDEESASSPYGGFIVEDSESTTATAAAASAEPSTALLVARFWFYALFLGYKGVEVDAFYRLQAWVFGEGTDFWTIFIKVVVDQFVWNPVYAAPSNTLGFMWKDCDFSIKRLASELGWDFIFYRVPSVLCSTWLVWVPAVSLIYSLPSTLQIPLFNLVLCFFILILSFISKSASS